MTLQKTNNRDELINQALADMDQIESIILNVSELTASVSQEFSNIGSSVRDFGYGVSGFLQDNRKYLFKDKGNAELASLATEVASEVIGGAISFFGDLYSDYKRGKQMAKLLVLKQEIATEKIETMEYTLGAMKKNIGIFQQVVNEYIKAEYNTNELFNSELSQKHIESMALAMHQYKKATFLLMISQYMVDEYNAWLSGKHSSKTIYPCGDVITKYIVYTILYPEEKSALNGNKSSKELINEDAKLYLHTNDMDKVSGRFLYLIIDDQLLSKLLYDIRNKNLLDFITGSSTLTRILDKKEPYQIAKASQRELINLEDTQAGDRAYTIYRISIFSVAAFVAINYYSSFGWWFLPLVFLIYWFVFRLIGKAAYENFKEENEAAIKKEKSKLKDGLYRIIDPK